MRVLCTSTPMEGVVGPLLPIARALRDRGHDVQLAVGPDVQGRVEAAGFAATVVGPSAMEAAMRTMADAAAASSPGAGPAFGAVMFGEVFAPDLLPPLRRIADAFVPDVVVHPPVELASPIVAAERGIPSVTYGFGQLLAGEMVRALADRVSPLWEAAGVAADEHAGIYRDCFLDPCPPGMRLGPVAPARVVQAIRPEIPGATSDALPATMASLGDRPLLYVTLGTVPIFNQLATFEVLLDAVAQDGDIDVVATIGSNNDPVALAPRPANVHICQWLPLRPLLDRCHAVVCHGGSGTTLAALNAALPMVIVPLGADQFENALACERAGTARVVRPGDVEASVVRDAVRAVMAPGSPEQQGARLVAGEIAAMPEPFDAMAIIETLTG